MNTSFQNKLRGLILGTAVGDSLGFPAENLSAKSIAKLGWQNWRHRLFFGRGMVSDDTEHTLFVYQALITHWDNVDNFKKSLAWKLRLWLLGIPVGIGFGTLRAILKLWLFIPLSKSGLYTAGNGPAMRCAVIGAYFHENPQKIYEYTKASTELTHTDPRALTGALAISYAAAESIRCESHLNFDKKAFIDKLYQIDQDEEWTIIVDHIKHALENNMTVSQFAEILGLSNRVSGYIFHSVPVALYSWLHHYGDFQQTLTSVLNLGGDTDTVGAITGAIAGTAAGENGIPKQWTDGVFEYPRTVNVLRSVADKLIDENSNHKLVKYFWPAISVRNIFQTILVFAHIALRALPKSIRKILNI